MQKLIYLLPLACCLLLLGCDAPTSSLNDDDFLTAPAAGGDHLAGTPLGKRVPTQEDGNFGLGVPSGLSYQSQLVNAVRVQIEKFANVADAEAAGYVNTVECVSAPGLGTMGIHFVNPELASDAKINPFEPEALLYIPEADGAMRLVAAEYIVPRDVWEAIPGNEHRTPFLAGVPFDQHFGPELSHGEPDHYDLHLWAYQENPLGTFFPFNPTLSCQHTVTVSAVTLNIWNSQQDWPHRLEMIVDSLSAMQPDVVFLQEVLQNPDLPNQAETLANRLGYHYYFASVDGPEKPKRYGNAVLTRGPILADGWKWLDPSNDYRVIAYVHTEVRGRSLDVYVTHLHHTEGGGSIRQKQIADALAFINRTSSGAPILFGGDFNAVAGASELQALYGRFGDTYATVHPEAAGTGPTTLNPVFGHTPRRIDHVFFEKDAGWHPEDAEVIFDEPTSDGTWASDHFGVYTRFTLTSDQP